MTRRAAARYTTHTEAGRDLPRRDRNHGDGAAVVGDRQVTRRGVT